MSVTQSVDAVPASYAVVESVAAREGVEPTELAPLIEVVDPEAIDRLVETTAGRGSALQIQFSYLGYEVTVTGEGVVDIETDRVRE